MLFVVMLPSSAVILISTTFGGGIMDERVAVIGAILEDPTRSQSQFNRIVAEYHDLVRGRMGLPLKDKCMSVISITVVGTMDQINTMTGRLGNLEGVTVKTAISR